MPDLSVTFRKSGVNMLYIIATLIAFSRRLLWLCATFSEKWAPTERRGPPSLVRSDGWTPVAPSVALEGALLVNPFPPTGAISVTNSAIRCSYSYLPDALIKGQNTANRDT